ncbi:MAG: hypothetical protein JWO87_3468 [Phycisphaerales bacterium]|nr:hypothetical protein [Phycisphaerales bacterium]
MSARIQRLQVRRPRRQPSAFEALRQAVDGDAFWEEYLKNLSEGTPSGFSVHLAILVDRFLQAVLEGRKTIESRFSVFRCPPFGRVREGDVLLLKKSGGAVMGICRVGKTWSYELDRDSRRFIRDEFSEAMCAQDDEFWRARERGNYATLMQVKNVRRITPMPWQKKDRRGWVVLQAGESQRKLERESAERCS